MYREIVVGYDTREEPGPSAAWTPERRAQYLLKDVPVPLSVDEMVWMRRGAVVDGASFTIESPRFDTLDDALAARAPGEVVIAITAFEGPGQVDLVQGRTLAPAVADPAWRRLGWDVADGFFPSGLTNCGGAHIPGDWASMVNEHHLFDELPAAFAFRDACDRRIPEHSPFSVLGLYRLSP